MEIMLDLETYGTSPGSVILSIGACTFDKNGLGAQFYEVINLKSSLSYGLTTSEATMKWWDGQSTEAKEVLRMAKNDDPEQRESVSLEEALEGFSRYVRSHGQPGIWGLGATFDNVLLRAAYEKAGMQCPWHFRKDRCFRTLWALAPGVTKQRHGTHHNALDDAVFQASVAQEILAGIEYRLPMARGHCGDYEATP